MISVANVFLIVLLWAMTQAYEVSASIVLYRHRYVQISDLVEVILGSSLEIKLFLIDNSPSPDLKKEIPVHPNLIYHYSGKNLGYGKAHNVALRKILNTSRYHFVLNPDIHLNPENLIKLLEHMETSPNIGLLMPKVLYGNGELQYLCKMFPTPFDLIMRRFIPGFLKERFQERLNHYELKHKDYDQMMEVPNLSGCFMLIRVEVLRIVGLFDERFFMYLEDTDLSRRINMQFRTVYYPTVSITHAYEKGSYKNFKLLRYHIMSAFRYFNKYGWFFDTVRSTINASLH